MPMTINTNVASLNAQRNLNSTKDSLATSLQRLSSGLRVNTAKDDAAGLAVAERIHAQVRGFNVAMRNANDAISLMQVADGGAAQISENVQRMRELAVQSANGTLNSGDRANLEVEFSALYTEVDRLSQATRFNNVGLLDAATTFTFQIGAGTTANDQITVSTSEMRASTLLTTSGVAPTVGGSTGSNALAAITNLDTAINTITTTRARYGAALNRSTAVISSLSVAVENQAAARGRIIDADFAAETANLSRSQILQQAGTAMLAQANALPQQVLSLLQG